MLVYILLGLAAVIVILVIIAAMRPPEFRVTRSATVSGSPAAVFEQVNDLHKWEAWSPWAKLDPAAKNSFEGPPTGPGAVMKWEGNCKVGHGMMTITESRPAEFVRFRLEFLKPFAATHMAEFTFKPEGDKTLVTWSTSGRNNFMFKFMGLFMNCEKMLGRQFEQGLSNLNAVVKGSPASS